MLRTHLQRHMMPGLSLVVWTGTALAVHAPVNVLATGVTLFALFWLVEANAIEGDFEGRVPRNPIVMTSRVAWLFALAWSLVDAERAHVSTVPGVAVRVAGAALFLGGVALRLWSMRTLRRAFSYDLRVTQEQPLVTAGPYALVRHPAYTGIIVLSVACGVWNPSVTGFVALALFTLPQVLVRIAEEERLLAGHFGARWDEFARTRARLLPFVW